MFYLIILCLLMSFICTILKRSLKEHKNLMNYLSYGFIVVALVLTLLC